jgi:hypothetical protein
VVAIDQGSLFCYLPSILENILVRGWCKWFLTFWRLGTAELMTAEHFSSINMKDLSSSSRFFFDSSVPLLPTIWLTAVKHESLNFFSKTNKDPKACIGRFWDLVRIRKIVWILVNRSCFYDFWHRSQQSGWMCQKKVFLQRFDKAFSVEIPETSCSEFNKLKG